MPVSTRSLAATTVDLLGLSPGSPFPGPSLVGVWSGADSTPTPVYSFLHVDQREKSARAKSYRSIVEGSHQYIVSDGGEELLFDYESDPWEQMDLSVFHSDLLPHFRALVGKFATHSSRSAATGSTRAMRAAGTRQASAATPSKTDPTTTKVSVSVGLIP
jgi:hypothetical protein